MNREPSSAECARTSFADLEGMITDVMGWASALEAMGLSPSLIDPSACSVIGRALDDLVGSMRDRWDMIHRHNGGERL